MRSGPVVVASIRSEKPALMRLAQDNDVVHTFAPDRSDQPFDKTILPRWRRCDRFVPNAHGSQSAYDDGAIDPIAVPDHVTRGTVPRKSLGELPCDPLRRRVGCDVDPNEISAIYPYNREAIHHFNPNCRTHQTTHPTTPRP